MGEATADTERTVSSSWGVFFRPHRRGRRPWEQVGSAATEEAARRLMFDCMTGRPSGDWRIGPADIDTMPTAAVKAD